MNIGRISKIMEAYQPHNIKQTQQKRGSVGGDQVQISSEGRYYEFHDIARKTAAQLPDVREDKVAAVAKKMESGKYNVTPAMVAKKLLDFGT